MKFVNLEKEGPNIVRETAKLIEEGKINLDDIAQVEAQALKFAQQSAAKILASGLRPEDVAKAMKKQELQGGDISDILSNPQTRLLAGIWGVKMALMPFGFFLILKFYKALLPKRWYKYVKNVLFFGVILTLIPEIMNMYSSGFDNWFLQKIGAPISYKD